MKLHLLLALVAAFVFQAESHAQPFRSPKDRGLQGAYSMLRQTGNHGTVNTLAEKEQYKIYTDRYMIYASRDKADSLADFGIGTYQVKNGTATEYLFFTASGGTRNDTVELQIDQTMGGYVQVIESPAGKGKKNSLTEEYKNVSKNATSPLDGAWKQTRNTYVSKGVNTMTDSISVEYKVYESGNMLWVAVYRDSTTKTSKPGFGYGTFVMKGINAGKETYSSSTLVDLEGFSFDVQLEFNGKDSYTQTIIYPNGDRYMEVYQRLK